MPGRSVIITSAVGGVGEACARRFARNGDRLVIADQDEEAGQALLADLRGEGPRPRSFMRMFPTVSTCTISSPRRWTLLAAPTFLSTP